MLNIVQPQVQAWTGPKALRSVPNRSGRVLLRHRKDGRVGRRSRIGVGPLHLSARQGPLTVIRLTAHIVHT
jgi:hypothetical protein